MPVKDIENSIIVRILATQIPQLWEVVKFACTQADEVDKEDLPYYLNELLHALLSDKAQCFIRLGEDRTLLALISTRVMVDKITGKKYLFIQCLYSFKMVEDEVWKQDWSIILDFIKAEKCSYVSFNSRNERIWEITRMLGFKEKYRRFDYEVGGV